MSISTAINTTKALKVRYDVFSYRKPIIYCQSRQKLVKKLTLLDEILISSIFGKLQSGFSNMLYKTRHK